MVFERKTRSRDLLDRAPRQLLGVTGGIGATTNGKPRGRLGSRIVAYLAPPSEHGQACTHL